MDIHSTLCETHGLGKDGAREVMRTAPWLPPAVAVIAGTGDIAHARLRRGRSTTPPRHRSRQGDRQPAPRAGEIVRRADSGFYLHDVMDTCRKNMSGLLSARG